MTIEIQTKNLIIKKPEINDLKSLVEELHNWEISKWLINVPYPYTIEDGKNWLKKTKENEMSFNIFLKKKLIGGISLDTKENSAKLELGYWIGEKYWGNKYAEEACKFLIQFAFSNSPFQIIYASHMKENKKSEKILLNLGFTQISFGKKYSISRKEEVEDVNYKLLKS